MNGSARVPAPANTPQRRKRKPNQAASRERALDNRQRHPQRRRSFANSLAGKTRLPTLWQEKRV